MVEFWDSVSQILVVAIPVLISSIFAKYVIKSWQDKNEEFAFKKKQYELRKEILNDFENAYTTRLILINKFSRQLRSIYVTNFELKSEQEKNVVFSMDFPSDKDRLPINQFMSEYTQLTNSLIENSANIWKFFSTVRVYYDSSEFDAVMTAISSASTFCDEMLSVLFYSKTKEEFSKNYKIYLKSFDEFRDISHDLSHALVTKKMRIPSF